MFGNTIMVFGTFSWLYVLSNTILVDNLLRNIIIRSIAIDIMKSAYVQISVIVVFAVNIVYARFEGFGDYVGIGGTGDDVGLMVINGGVVIFSSSIFVMVNVKLNTNNKKSYTTIGNNFYDNNY